MSAGPSIQIFNKTLTDTFAVSQPFLIANNTITLDFKLDVTAGPASVEWYLEFGEDPSASGEWYREMAQEDPGGGVVLVPEVVRTFANNGASDLTSPATYFFDTELVRRHKLARVQIRVTDVDTMTVVATIRSQFGALAVAAT